MRTTGTIRVTETSAKQRNRRSRMVMKLRMTVRLEIQMKVIQTPMKEQMIQKMIPHQMNWILLH